MLKWLLIAAATVVAHAHAAESEYDLRSKPKVRVEGDGQSEPSAEAHPANASGESRPSTSGGRRSVIKSNKITNVDQDSLLRKPEKALGVPQNFIWGGEVNYQIRTDFADQVKPRLYNNALGLSYGFFHAPSQIAVAAVVTAMYESAGERRSEILVDEDRRELFVNDFALAVQKAWSLFEASNIGLTFANEFPTSAEAQREKYNSVSSLELASRLAIIPRVFTAIVAAEVHYIWNSYEYSPATGFLNKQSGTRATVGLRWRVWRGLQLEGNAGAQSSRYLDGTSDPTYRNSFGFTYLWPTVAVGLTYVNGTYLDQGDANIWFVDEYRQILAARLRYSF